jgi:L-threonylcarbamoyladenylate synthase
MDKASGFKKNTLILKNALEDRAELELAARIIRRGGLVVFPTETVYGLGANALDDAAVRAIFAAKGRPSDNPLIAHVSGIDQALEVAAEIPEMARKLFERFSPGPLTIVLPKLPDLPDSVTAGLPTVAVRIPSHPVARALIEAAGLPIVAPSSNLSGRPSPTSFAMALADMDGRVDAVIDGGECEHGLESTVVSVAGKLLRILRPGAVTQEMLAEFLSAFPGYSIAEAPPSESAKPLSPGMKYAHYQPKAEVYLASRIDPELARSRFPGKRIAFIFREPAAVAVKGVIEGPDANGDFLLRVASRTEYARLLYRAFYGFDARGVAVIVAQTVEESGIGRALMNRLRKASAGKTFE